MNKIHDSFVNALLADATYVNRLTRNLSGKDLTDVLKSRMTTALAMEIKGGSID